MIYLLVGALKMMSISMTRGESVIRSRASLYASAVTALFAVAVTADRAEASTIGSFTYDIFLSGSHSAPSEGEVTTQSVYLLDDPNSSMVMRRKTLVSNFTFNIGQAATLDSFDSGSYTDAFVQPTALDQLEKDPSDVTVTLDPSDPTDKAYVASELATWDNVGVSGTTVDPGDQVDLGRNTWLTFDLGGGITDFIIAELGGLNPFRLLHCPDALCSTSVRLFNGFNRGLRDSLLAQNEFSINDTGAATDQFWLFRFAAPVTGFLRIAEFDDRNFYTNARLQVDYVGAVPVAAPSEVPLPGGLPLVAAGLGLLAWVRLTKQT